MNKFGFICSRKGEIFWRKTQRNEKNSAITRPQAVVSPSVTFLFWLVNELRRMVKNILCLQGFFLNVLKFDLYLLKQSIFRVLKRDLERAYLMIVGQSSYFTSCYWHFNLCTAIFYQLVWSMNSKEWPQIQVFSVLSLPRLTCCYQKENQSHSSLPSVTMMPILIVICMTRHDRVRF